MTFILNFFNMKKVEFVVCIFQNIVYIYLIMIRYQLF